MDDDREEIFIQRLSLRSLLLEAYETFTNCRWLFELYLCRRTRYCCLKLRINEDQVTFIRAVKPWLHVDNMIHISAYEAIDCLQILSDLGVKDVARIRKLATSTTFTSTLSSFASIFAKYPSMHALKLVVTNYGLVIENAKHITDLLALRKLRELTLVGGYISPNFDNVDTKKLSTLRILCVNMFIDDGTSEGRVNFFKGLKNLATINIDYDAINIFARDSHFFGDLIDATLYFGYDSPLLDQAVSRMPALKKLALSLAEFQWQTLATACPRVQIVRLIDCKILGDHDNSSHALYLTTLDLEFVLWYPRGWYNSSFVEQMTASVLQYLRIGYQRVPEQYSPENAQSVTVDMMGALRKLKEDPRLLANCTTSIVRYRSSLYTVFKTARHDRIRVFLSRHADF